MISSEVQRTLVKSPPELWAEISDPESLARHLGEFGEIRITRIQPEQKVEWEAQEASGTVAIKPSGWGTKVKLTVTRELHLPEAQGELKAQEPALPDTQVETEAQEIKPETPPQPEDSLEVQAEPEPDVAEAKLEPEPEPNVAEAKLEPASNVAEAKLEPEPDVAQVKPAEPPPSGEAEALLDAEDELDADAAPGLAAPAPEPARGFFARLFGRRRRPAQTTPAQADEPHDPTEADEPRDLAEELEAEGLELDAEGLELDATEPRATEPGAAEPEEAEPEEDPREDALSTQAGAQRSAAAPSSGEVQAGLQPPPSDRQADIAAEIKAAEEIAAEQVTAVLTGVLDRLGAAHHRPFSRA